MTWFYVAVIEFLLNCALAYFLYLKGKENGKMQERNGNYLRMIDAQAEAISQAEAREKNYDERMQNIEKRLDHTNLAIIPDPELTSLFKNPTLPSVPTDPERISDIETTREAVSGKI